MSFHHLPAVTLAACNGSCTTCTCWTARDLEIRERHPKGLTPDQFRRYTLTSASADGRVDPPSVSGLMVGFSLLFGMELKGLLVSRGGKSSLGPWYITDKGRALLEEY